METQKLPTPDAVIYDKTVTPPRPLEMISSRHDLSFARINTTEFDRHGVFVGSIESGSNFNSEEKKKEKSWCSRFN